MQRVPPTFLWIVSALFILAGVWSVLEMLWGLVEGSFNLNIGFVFIPAGYGLMIGRDSSRRWARLWCGLLGFGCLVGLVTMAINGSESVEAEGLVLGSTASVVSWWLCGIGAIVGVYSFFRLRRTVYGDWFDEPVDDTKLAKRFRWAIVVLTIYSFTSYVFVEIVLGSDGYDELDFSISRDTPSHVQLGLKRTHEN